MPAPSLRLEYPLADVAVVTLDEPQKSVNVLSRAVLDELSRVLDQTEKRTDLAGLAIRSAKPGQFVAGADVREFLADIDAPREHVQAVSRRGQELFARLAATPFVTVAAIDGACLGGGAELALWCDRRLMTDAPITQLGLPEVKLGLFPGWGGTARLPRLVGLGNAVEMITGGESIDAAAAAAMGLAERVIVGTRVVGSAGGGEPAGPVDAAAWLRDDPLGRAALATIRAQQASRKFTLDRQSLSQPLAISETELAFLGATASAYIQGQTKGFYPAPLAALELLLSAALVDLPTACAMETEAFAPLFGSPVNRALLNVFVLRETNKKSPGRVEAGVAGGPIRPLRRAAVVGAGVMGQGIAAAHAKRGVPVTLADVSPEAVGRGVQGVLAEASYNKQLKGPDAQRILELAPLVAGAVDDAPVAAADAVIEAVFEDLSVKRALLLRLEPQLAPDALLASNTSTIPLAELAAELKRPDRFCGLHFFNPVRQMPLVEVIRGPKTSDAAVAAAVEYARRLGKSPIVVADGPGFLVNRVLLPYMNEALLLLEEGASIKEVDRAATSFGMPMGPITLYDTVGLDVALHAGGVMQRAFPHRVASSTILPAMVAAGRLGKKAGRGFFNYGGKKADRGEPSPEVEQLLAAHRPAPRKFTRDELTDRLLLPMLLEATRVLEDGVAASPQDVDLALIYGIGFPPFRGGLLFWADSLGAAAIRDKLAAYRSLGARFEPTPLLDEVAASAEGFYRRRDVRNPNSQIR